jgi:hypothetical protein
VEQPKLLLPPIQHNLIWSSDFMIDPIYNGITYRTINVTDAYDRGVVRVEVSMSLNAERMIRGIGQFIKLQSCSERLRVDQGPEFSAAASRPGLDYPSLRSSLSVRQVEPERLHRMTQRHPPRFGAGYMHESRPSPRGDCAVAQRAQPETPSRIPWRRCTHRVFHQRGYVSYRILNHFSGFIRKWKKSL